MRPVDSVTVHMAGLQQLMTCLVNRRLFMMDRTQDRVPVGPFGHEREVLANLDAGYVGSNRLEWSADGVRGCRLGVPGIELARAANEEKLDAGLFTGSRG